MSLVELFNGMQKTAGQASNRQPDKWDRAAAAAGMSTDQYLDKVAEAYVQEQVVMTKQAQVANAFGEHMAQGYWDTMSKIANAHPVRDGVPEVYIKIAQASKAGLMQNLLKVAGILNPPQAAQFEGQGLNILQKLLGYGKQQAGRGVEATKDFFRPGVAGAEKLLGVGRGKAPAAMEAELAQLRQGLEAAAGGATAGTRGEVARRGSQLSRAFSPEEARIAAMEPGEALKDVGLRLGLPALGVGAAGTGIAAGMGAFD